ncbi:hypothetical protein Hanom_Chr12g01120791 [Helianthus anomalus]
MFSKSMFSSLGFSLALVWLEECRKVTETGGGGGGRWSREEEHECKSGSDNMDGPVGA